MKTVQQILIMETGADNLRSEVISWDAEDPSLYRQGQPVGMTPGFSGPYQYPNVLSALSFGWKLMAPPKRLSGGVIAWKQDTYEWWLSREVEAED